MSELKGVDLTSFGQIEIFKHWSKESINEHLNLGWKLLNINNVTEEERNLETGEYEKFSITLFTLGWPSDLGEIRLPDKQDKDEANSSFNPFDHF